MKIGVISDTHLRRFDERLAKIANDHFRDVDLVLHAGDLVSMDVLRAFEGIEVKAVCGNMDGDEERTHLPEQMVLEVQGYRIGLIHGWGMPFGLESKLRKKFDAIDCLVYGHTHSACNKVKDGVLYFNPGSATDRFFTKINTVGILEIDQGIRGQIIEIPR